MRSKNVGKVLAALIAVFSLALVAVPAGAAPTAPGATTYTTYFDFSSATDTFTFDVSATQGSGTLTVETMDCCIVGDLWVSTLEKGKSKKVTTGIGNGSTTEFSGEAVRKGWTKGTVTFSYASGVDIFPAGITVRITYTPNGKGAKKGAVITPLF
jgi:hypothetical protein